jgi:hypothetical protein
MYIYIPTSPDLTVGGILRPGRVTRHGWPGHPPPSSTVPGGPATRAVDPVGLEGESLNTKGPFFIFLKVFLGFSLLEMMRGDHKEHL